MKKIFSTYSKTVRFVTVALALALVASVSFAYLADAAINKEMNYQGKLMDSSNVSVSDGTYNMEFKLYTVASGGSPIWTETRTSADKVQVTSGLFSVLLGSVTSLAGVDFNQTLYLGVNIGGTSTPGWDGEMTPRKKIGSVPSAFVAETLNGFFSHQFFRNDAINSTSSALTFMKIEQAGAGAIAEFVGTGSTTAMIINSDGTVGIGTTTPAARLAITGISGSALDVLTVASSTQSRLFSVSPAGNITASGSVVWSSNGNSLGNNTLSFAGNNSTVIGNVSSGASAAVTVQGGANAASSLTLKSTSGVGTTDYVRMVVGNNGATEALRAISNGNVGIGTTTPAQALSVAGGMRLTGAFFDSANASGTAGMVLQTTGTGTQWVATSSLGIIGGSGTNYLSLGDGYIAASTSTDAIRAAYFVASSTTATSTFAGAVGIGTTTALSTLFVQGKGGTNPFAIASSTGVSMLVLQQNGFLGIGTSSPLAALSVSGSGYFDGTATFATTTATTTIAGGLSVGSGAINYDWSTGVTSIDSLELGALAFAADGGIMSWVDMDVTTSSATGTVESYSAQIDGNSLLTVYAEANGSGGIQNSRIGVGTTTPGSRLDVWGNLNVATSSVSSLFVNTALTRVGIGTSTPAQTLSVSGDMRLTGAFFDSANASGTAGMILQTTGTGTQWVATSSLGIMGGSGTNYLSLGSGHVYTSTSTDYFQAAYFVASSTTATSTFAGAVGIGTTTASSMLFVQGKGGLNPFAIASSTGTSMLTMLQNGDLGLGTTTPAGAVEAMRSGANSLYFATVYNSGNGFNSGFIGRKAGGSASAPTSTPFGSNMAVFGARGYGPSGFVSTSNGLIAFQAEDTFTGSAQGTQIIFETTAASSTTRNQTMVLTGAGSLGVGTTTPTSVLHVQGRAGLDPFAIASSTGTSMMTMLQNGNLGIGTTTPAQTLSVAGDMRLTGAFFDSANASGTAGMILQTTGTGTQWVATSSLGIMGGSGTNYLSLGSGHVYTSTSTDYFQAAYFVASSTTASSFINASTTGFTLAGTFHVPGMADGCVQVTGGVATSTGTGCGGGSGNSAFTIASGMIYNATSTDLVGIGTTSPSTTLFVQGKGGTNPFAVASSTGTDMLTLLQDGNLGIGTTTPSSALDVAGVISVNGFRFAFVPSGLTDVGSAIGIGYGALASLTTGLRNVAIGKDALTSLTTGYDNVAIGAGALDSAQTSSNSNVAIGRGAGGAVTGGGSNTFIGTLSGKNVTTGSNNIVIGYNTTAASTTGSNQLNIGGLLFGDLAAGKIGIGTSTSAHALSVSGDMRLTGAFFDSANASGTAGMVLQTTGTGTQWVATSSLGIIGGSGTNYLSLGSGHVYTSTSTDWFQSAYFVASSTTATSTFAGAVGIGTTTPSTALYVVGTTTSTYFSGNGAGLTGITATAAPAGNSGNVQFNNAGATGGSDSLFWDISNSRLGIGTTTPGSPLTISSSANDTGINMVGNINSFFQANIQNLNSGASASSDWVATANNGSSTAHYIDMGINGSAGGAAPFTAINDAYLYSIDDNLNIGALGATSSVKFYTTGGLSPVERMRITQAGYVGIGTTTPAEMLHVAGNILIGARADTAAAWTKRSDATAGTIASGGTSSIGTTTVMGIFNGSLYAGTAKPNGAEVYRYNGSSWTQVSSTTAGSIGTTTTVNIDAISSMTVWDGQLYVGTAETGAAEVYRYNGNSNWTKISSSTAGAIGSTATTTAIDSVSAMTVHGGKLYVGTSKANSAEIYRYNGPGLQPWQTWTKVSNVPGNFGTIGATANVDAVTTLTSFQGYLYAGTSEAGSSGALYRYDGQGTTGTGFLIMGSAGTFSGNSAAGVSAITSVGSIRTAAVYHGRIYLGIDDGAGTARVVKWEAGMTSGGNYDLTSSTTAGVIAEDIGAQTGIDRVMSMSVYNDDLYVGTVDSTGIGEVYKLDNGSTWSKISSTTAGTISTASGAQTGSITGAFSMAVYNDDLWVGTEKASAAEIYSYNIAEGQSYKLAFDASSDEADGIQNGLTNRSFIQFQGEENSYNSSGRVNSGNFVFSHGINTVTGAYDLAEDYPTNDDTLAPGDLVSLDTRRKGFVRRAQGKNDKDVIGIYSVDPALRLSQETDVIDGARAIPVALAGRVPVTVTLENGPIRIGDYLTSSMEPGKAAKANKPGRVIGRALGAYAGSEGEEPSVTVFIGAESIGWNDLQDAEADVTEIADESSAADKNAVIAFVDTVNGAVEDIAFAILNKADGLNVVITNKFTALVASVQDLFAKNLSILPNGSISLPSGDNQIAGIGMLSIGATDVFIANEQVDENTIVYITPTSAIDSPLYVAKKEPGKGFSVRIKSASQTEITFDWFFIKTYRPKGKADQEVVTTVEGSSASSTATTTTTVITTVSPDTASVTSDGEGQAETVTSAPVSSADASGGTDSESTPVVTSEGGATVASPPDSESAASEPSPAPDPAVEPASAPAPEPAPAAAEPVADAAPAPAPAAEPAPAPSE